MCDKTALHGKRRRTADETSKICGNGNTQNDQTKRRPPAAISE
jgi:hypothetical protein